MPTFTLRDSQRYRAANATALSRNHVDFDASTFVLNAYARSERGGGTGRENVARATGADSANIQTAASDIDLDACAHGYNTFATVLRNSQLSSTNRSGIGINIDANALAEFRGLDPAIGLENSTITSTAAADTISISATSRHVSGGSDDRLRADAFGMSKGSVINSGAGDDSISVSASLSLGGRSRLLAGSINAIDRSQINAGAGDDDVTLSASAPGEAFALFNSSVDLGSGDDSLTLSGLFADSSVDGGSGHDEVHIAAGFHDDHELIENDDSTYDFVVDGNRLNLSGVEEIHLSDGTVLDLQPTMNPGITRTINTTTVSENGHQATFTYKLNSRPWEDVVITLSNSDETEVSLNRTQLVFTADNWNQAQTVVATGLSDRLVDGTQQAVISHTIRSNDFDYAPRRDGTGGISISNIVLSNLDADQHQTLYGDRGYTYNDRLNGGDGDDRLYGVYGRDQLSGGYGNDRIYGGYDDDVLHGDQGNDQLYGEYGDDRIFGGSGNDLIDGGQGADYMSGGAGNDTYYVDNSGDVIDDRGSSNDEDTIILQNSVRYKLGSSVENGTGTNGSDTLIGNNSSNELVGNAGNDVLTGQGGRDVLTGGSGTDTISGGGGTDRLIGGSSADTLIGGGGSDRLDGGSGSDTMTGGSGRDTFVLRRGTGYDIVEDFSNRDQITVQGFNDNRVRVVERDGDALLYAKGDLLARVVDGAGMNII